MERIKIGGAWKGRWAALALLLIALPVMTVACEGQSKSIAVKRSASRAKANHKPPVLVSPDIDEMKRMILRIAKRESDELKPLYGEDATLRAVYIKRISEIPHLVGDENIVLVYFIAEVQWDKISPHTVLLLRETDDGGFDNIFYFAGGQNWRGVDVEIMDLNESDDQQDLVLFDGASGNQMAQSRAHIFMYDKERDKFVEKFNELISWMPMYTKFSYHSTVDFPDKPRGYKDVVIETKLTWMDGNNNELGDETRTAVYNWNGDRYVGHMDLPKREF